jgi:outer membrane biosynthesis protein TonB
MVGSSTVERRIVMGLGDAVLRLIHVEAMYANGVDPGEVLIGERNLIVEALNEQFRLDLGMDCDQDGIPDAIDDDVQINDVAIFKTSAETSCCRILPEGVKEKTRTVVSESRKKKPASKAKSEAPEKVEVEVAEKPKKPKKPKAPARKPAKAPEPPPEPPAVVAPPTPKAPEPEPKKAKTPALKPDAGKVRGTRKPSKDLSAARKPKRTSWNPFSKD